jgi:hypothetical protein
MRRSSSTPSLKASESAGTPSLSQDPAVSSPHLIVDTTATPLSPSLDAQPTPNPMQKAADAANAVLMDRAHFAIDEAGDEDDDFFGDDVGGDDDQVMDEASHHPIGRLSSHLTMSRTRLTPFSKPMILGSVKRTKHFIRVSNILHFIYMQ